VRLPLRLRLSENTSMAERHTDRLPIELLAAILEKHGAQDLCGVLLPPPAVEMPMTSPWCGVAGNKVVPQICQITLLVGLPFIAYWPLFDLWRTHIYLSEDGHLLPRREWRERSPPRELAHAKKGY
jgi:hypothetical protein